ncbi:DUF6455 family protein [Shimia aestuarii]|uniref:DUF6455 domain-containing protein n=1 Tax=Shimia aestuarii TaxID=254406 RepID=A0A1I4R362_9RHOB|nr:DUF6455 family protein [Shimia aestuarii]SFM46565.1 hypothetical protein SAMN04488042_107235 [Shimia aestuarii]
MKPLGESNTHYWLAQRMAKVTETDLVAAMAQAELSQAEWAEMVEDCRGCDWTRGCKRWLAEHDTESAEAPPRDCVNQDKFEKLKDALEALE